MVTVRIIAISGGGSWSWHGERVEADNSLDNARHFGADRTLEKPLKIHQLLALESFRTNPDRFDLVFTDQAMPRMAVTQRIRKILR